MFQKIFQWLFAFFIFFAINSIAFSANVTVKNTLSSSIANKDSSVNSKKEKKAVSEKKIEQNNSPALTVSKQNDITMQNLKLTNGFHIVKDGETLFGIARAYSASYSSIIQENVINEIGSIRVGQKIKIPQIETNDATVQNLVTHEVVKQAIPLNGIHSVIYGETLFGIARIYSVSPIDIAAENEFDLSHLVKVGDKLKIPNKETVYVVKNEKKDEISTIQTEKLPDKNTEKSPMITSLKKNAKQCEFNFLWPVQSRKMLKKYGEILKNGVKNDGVIIESSVGTDVLASYDGEVVYVGNDITEYGNLMMVKHKDNWITIYGYLKSFYKKSGDKVSKGDEIGKSGQTGDAITPSLYFSIRKVKTPYNPELCI